MILVYIYIYSAIRRKLKPGQVVIINLFRQGILLYSPSRQMTFWGSGTANVEFQSICLREKKLNPQARAKGVKTIGIKTLRNRSNLSTYTNNPHPLSFDADWVLYIYIYIYIYIQTIRTSKMWYKINFLEFSVHLIDRLPYQSIRTLFSLPSARIVG